jgi:alpha-D-xyloside xylohydrolase
MTTTREAAFIAAVLIASCAAVHEAKASIISSTKDPDGMTFTLDRGKMKVKICREDIVEIQYTTLRDIPSRSSLVIVDTWEKTPGFQVSERPEEFVISTGRLNIKVSRSTNSVTYTDLNDVTILAEDGAAGKRMAADTVAGIITHACETEFVSPENEGLFGLGCHPEDAGTMNYKGRNQEMAIRYMTGAIPVLLSTRGYGLMWDNYSASNFYGAEGGNTKFKYVSESGDCVDYYFFYGPEFDHIIALYRTATGQAPMFPKWSFGLFQSQDRYKSQAEVLSVKDRYRKGNIPLDCIVQDWFYWEPDVIGSHVMWPERYPSPRAMVDELHRANVHAMISIWPVFAKGSKNYDAMSKAGNLTSIVWDNAMTHTLDSYYDAHSPKARAMYWQQARDSLIAPGGWDAWWVDQCEPDNGNLLDARKQCNFAIGRGIDYFNTYSLVHSTGLYKNWRTDVPGKRAFFLIRQAFAGQQRNATTLWSSDIMCTFDALDIQIAQGINACASGIPYWTSDIGGYHLNWNAPDWSTPDNRELFTRWFQFGAFCPVFRIHGKGERALFSENWDANTKAILLKYDNLRYRLLPYIYSLSWKVTSESYTMMRALAFDFRTDASVRNILDQYMFGPAFLVNPVTRPMDTYEGFNPADNSRKVYLPRGTDWIDFWGGYYLKGGQTISSLAPIETLPLYVRAGSIVPLGPLLQFSTEKPADPIELRVYPGADGEFTLYEDENDTYNYEKGAFATIQIRWDEHKNTLTIGDRHGNFPGMLKERTFHIVWVGPRHGIGAAEEKRPDATVSYIGKAIAIKRNSGNR